VSLASGSPALPAIPPGPAWPDLAARATDPELLDARLPEAEVRKSLADLRFVNRWLGARGAFLRAVAPHVTPGGRLLDVGCGSGDVLAWLRSRLSRAGLAVGLDIKPVHLRDGMHLRGVAGDVRRLPFAAKSFDVVTACLFLHHFGAGELPALLRELARVARHAIVVSDLRRAAVPYQFGRAAFPLLFKSRVSVHDGLVSIRRAFHDDELQGAFRDAGLSDVQLRRVFPYRLLVVARTGPA
jgi:ubiquinone/menaquinone biosynthesis C-methylase UbiE